MNCNDAPTKRTQLGIYHRDIKPDNVLLVEKASTPSGMVAKLTDFGLARVKVGSANCKRNF